MFPVGAHELGQADVGELAVADTGQGVLVETAFHVLELTENGLVPGVVRENLHRSDDVARIVMQGVGADEHGHPVPMLVVQVDLGGPGHPVVHGGLQGAAAQTEGLAVLGHVTQQVVGAALSENLFPGIPGNELGAAIPENDPPVPVHDVHAVEEMIEKGQAPCTQYIFKHCYSPDECPEDKGLPETFSCGNIPRNMSIGQP